MPSSVSCSLRSCFAGLTIAAGSLMAVAGGAQTLAHPNWVGNGMSTDPWYQHAVIYRLDSTPGVGPGGGVAGAGVDFKYLAARINAVRTVGIDALLVPAPSIPGAPGAAASGEDAQSRVDQLDDLVRVASNRGVRILLTLTPVADTDLIAVARFWLNRGVAGFYVEAAAGTNTAEMQATVQLLRRQVASVVGQRIVISNLDLAMPDGSVAVQAPAPVVRRGAAGRVARSSDTAPELEIDTRLNRLQMLDAGSLRPMLTQSAGQGGLLLDFDPAQVVGSRSGAMGAVPKPNSMGLAEIRAAIALVTHPAALIESDAKLVFEPTPEHVEEEEQPKPAPAPVQTAPGVFLPYKPYVAPKKAVVEVAPKDPLTIWYKQLAALHHGNAAFRSGSETFLDFDAQNALVWVARPASVTNLTPAIVVACNLSGAPVTLAMNGQVEALGLRGNYLRTLLRSNRETGPEELNAVTLPPYSVYVGEVRK